MIKFGNITIKKSLLSVSQLVGGRIYKMHLDGQWNGAYVLVHTYAPETAFATLLTKGDPTGFRLVTKSWLDCGTKFEEVSIQLDITEF